MPAGLRVPVSALPRPAGRFRKIAGATAITIISSIAQMVRRSMTQFTGSRNGIEATGMERVAASQPANSQPASPEGAVTVYRLERVLGTGRGKTAAGRKERRDDHLITSDQSRDQPPRSQRQRHRSSSSENGIAPGGQLRPQFVEAGSIGVATSPYDEVVAALSRLEILPPDFPQLSPQTIAGHRR